MRKKLKTATCLTRLEAIKTVFNEDSGRDKLQLLNVLNRGRLTTSNQVRHLHDLLCFICAYPDSREIYQTADTMLQNFGKRGDLKQHRKALANSGIAGTTVDYQFYWPMARWLAHHWPEQLRLLWSDIEDEEKLIKILQLLVSQVEAGAFDEFDCNAMTWIEQLKGPAETDAVFYVKRLESAFSNDFEREAIHDDLNLSYRLLPGPTTPDINTAKFKQGPIVFQSAPLQHQRPVLTQALHEINYICRQLSSAEGRTLVNLARMTMVTHERDLDVFSYGNAADVTLFDFRDGYQIASIGFIPERRYLLHATYGFLNLKNGLPIGYFPLSTVFRTADVAFNLFSAFRGGEASLVYTRNLAISHRVYGVNTFIVDPYQLGYNNKDGLKSGVWWFYYKLGFRPRDSGVRKLLRRELAQMKRVPGYRSDLATLNKLASGSMYFNIDGSFDDHDVLSSLSSIAPGISAYLACRFGSEREKGLRTCSIEAAKKAGVPDIRKFSADERRAWQRWSPLLLNLGNIERWPVADRRALVRLVRAKGKQRETGYLSLANSHKRLKDAVLNFITRVNQ